MKQRTLIDPTSVLIMTRRDFNMVISTLLSKSTVTSIPVKTWPLLVRCFAIMIDNSVIMLEPHMVLHSIFSASLISTFSTLKNKFSVVGSMGFMFMFFK